MWWRSLASRIGGRRILSGSPSIHTKVRLSPEANRGEEPISPYTMSVPKSRVPVACCRLRLYNDFFHAKSRRHTLVSTMSLVEVLRGLRAFQHYLLRYVTMVRLATRITPITAFPGIFWLIIRPQVASFGDGMPTKDSQLRSKLFTRERTWLCPKWRLWCHNTPRLAVPTFQ